MTNILAAAVLFLLLAGIFMLLERNHRRVAGPVPDPRLDAERSRPVQSMQHAVTLTNPAAVANRS